MKKFILFAISFAMMPILSMAQDDDLYFTPVKKEKKSEKKEEAVVKRTPRTTFVIEAEDPTVEVYTRNSRNEDEYNRRFNNGNSYGETAENTDVESEDSDDRSYENNEDDYYYSRRILRFRSPRVGIAVSSPLYWDLVYNYGAYDYLYNDYYVYDPFFWGYGWGYGWSWGPWSCWYGPIWGWHSPHHWHYWGCGPMWGGGIHHGPSMGFTRYNRGTFSNRYGNSNRIRTSALATNGSRSFSIRNAAGNRTSALGRGSFSIGDRGTSSGAFSSRGSAVQNQNNGQTRGTRTRGTNSSYSRSNSNSGKSSNYNRVSSSRSTSNTNNTVSGSERTSVRSNSTPSRSSGSSFQSSGSRGGFGGGGSFGGGSRGSSGGGSRGGRR